MKPDRLWRVGVIENRQQINLASQENFMVEFIVSLYPDKDQYSAI